MPRRLARSSWRARAARDPQALTLPCRSLHKCVEVVLFFSSELQMQDGKQWHIVSSEKAPPNLPQSLEEFLKQWQELCDEQIWPQCPKRGHCQPEELESEEEEVEPFSVEVFHDLPWSAPPHAHDMSVPAGPDVGLAYRKPSPPPFDKNRYMRCERGAPPGASFWPVHDAEQSNPGPAPDASVATAAVPAAAQAVASVAKLHAAMVRAVPCCAALPSALGVVEEFSQQQQDDWVALIEAAVDKGRTALIEAWCKALEEELKKRDARTSAAGPRSG